MGNRQHDIGPLGGIGHIHIGAYHEVDLLDSFDELFAARFARKHIAVGHPQNANVNVFLAPLLFFHQFGKIHARAVDARAHAHKICLCVKRIHTRTARHHGARLARVSGKGRNIGKVLIVVVGVHVVAKTLER